ncbi:hypothetical protein GGR52DRAFT_588569 [Hypoxylon sp. FL1284]|nr:hypothetical protein GGR52DRAFT_588569 [Hypoxylon sp. FL1284]
MEQADSYTGSEPDHSPGAHMDTRAVSDGPELVQLLEDSQETGHGDADPSTANQHRPSPYTGQRANSSYFPPLAMETVEEIGATFQFPKHQATRNVFHNSNGLQKILPKQPTPNQDIHCVPFPDVVESSRPSKAKHKSLRSSVSQPQLPKSIADTRQKALAQLSPHTRAPIAKSPLSNSAKAEGMISWAAMRARDEDLVECEQPSRSTMSSETLDENSPLTAKRTPEHIHPTKRQNHRSITRPVPAKRPEVEVTSVLRPRSQASNISKHRAPPTRNRRRHSPTREQNSLNLKKLAESWNVNQLYSQQLLDRWEQKMAMLKEHILDQDSIIEDCHREIESRDLTIDAMAKEIEELRNQSQAVHEEITASSAQRKKLEEKLRTFRTRLNDAVNEQQQLFLRCKERFQEATTDVKEESRARDDAIQKATVTSELIRAEIKQKVVAVVGHVNTQVDELNKTTESLEAELRQSRLELHHQKDQAASLREQLAGSHRQNDQSLQSIAAQNREILNRLDGNRQKANEADKSIQEKADALLLAFDEMKSSTVDSAALIEILRGAHINTIETIVTEIRSSAQSTASSALNNYKALNDNVDRVGALCDGIPNGVSEAKSAADWKSRAQVAELAAGGQTIQIESLQKQLHETRTLAEQRSGEKDELQAQLGILQANVEKENVTATKVKDLTTQVEQLHNSLHEKDADLIESKETLVTTQAELVLGKLRLRNIEEQLQNDRRSHAEAIEFSTRERSKAISDAVIQATERIEQEHRATERQREEEVIKERTQLEQELADLRQTEAGNRADTQQDLYQIKGELATANTLATNLAADLEESERGREALQESLRQWSRDRIAIGQMQQMIGHLAKEQPNANQMSDQLKELLELQRNLTDTVECHQAQLAEAQVAVAKGQTQKGRTDEPSETGSSSTGSQHNGAEHSSVELLNLKRKVMLKSPAGEVDGVPPMSIEEERSTRRRSVPPRGIMKPLTPNASGEVAASPPKRKIAQGGSKPINTHTLYNRPVAGVVPGKSQEQDDADEHRTKRQRQPTPAAYATSTTRRATRQSSQSSTASSQTLAASSQTLAESQD